MGQPDGKEQLIKIHDDFNAGLKAPEKTEEPDEE
jgi:hypothetical protein